MVENHTPSSQREGQDDSADTEIAPVRRTNIGAWLVLLAVVAGGAALYHFWGFWQQKTVAAAMPAPAVTVAKPLVRNLIQWNEFTGRFEATESVDVRARVSGYLESINFKDGQLVKKGELLFVIEPRPFELALESAKANLAQAKANLHLAKTELARTKQLKQKDFATQETLDTRQAKVEIGQADVEAEQAALDQAKLNLDYTHVVAPMSGRVSRHEVSVGNLVMGGTSGSTTLLTNIVTFNPIWLVFNVSEADGIAYKRLVREGKIPSARKGKVQVEGELMNGSKWNMRGVINFVDNQYDSSTGTILVRAVFPNSKMFITPGQFGRVRVPISGRVPTILIPDSAIVTDQSSKLVYVLGKDNKIVPKPIKLGPVVGDSLRVVDSGITADDKVVIEGLMRIRPGVTVSPDEGKIDPARAPQDDQLDPAKSSTKSSN